MICGVSLTLEVPYKQNVVVKGNFHFHVFLLRKQVTAEIMKATNIFSKKKYGGVDTKHWIVNTQHKVVSFAIARELCYSISLE